MSAIDKPILKGFRFYFSAFIGAARSVTWTMRSEEPARYAAWEPRWTAQLSPEDKIIEKMTNERQLDEVKRRRADVPATFEEMTASELMKEMGGDPAFLDKIYPGQSKMKSGRPRYFFENDIGKGDLLMLAKHYLDYLERKVGSFLAAHVGHD